MPPQGDQVPIRGEANDVLVVPSDKREIREALLALAQAINTHVTIDIGPRVNALKSTMTSRLREFVRMNPPIFLVSKMGEDPQEFLDGVYKVLTIMGMTSREKADLALY